MNWNDYFTYDAATGVLYHRTLPREMFKSDSAWIHSNKMRGNGIAMLKSHEGYVSVAVRRTTYKAHRVIWEMHNGPIPEGMVIDHINMDPLDNRLSNLRLATRGQNTMNKKGRSRCGLKGVSKHWNKWRSEVRAGGVRLRLGSFDTPEEAHAAYCAAAKELHGEFARFK